MRKGIGYRLSIVARTASNGLSGNAAPFTPCLRIFKLIRQRVRLASWAGLSAAGGFSTAIDGVVVWCRSAPCLQLATPASCVQFADTGILRQIVIGYRASSSDTLEHLPATCDWHANPRLLRLLAVFLSTMPEVFFSSMAVVAVRHPMPSPP